MIQQKAIDQIFNSNFDITKIDPKEYDTSFILTAIIHNHENIIHLDPYIEKKHIDILISLSLSENRVNFLQEITLMPKMTSILVNHLNNWKILIGSIKILSFENQTYSYKKMEENEIIPISHIAVNLIPCSLDYICNALFLNKTLNYPLIQELEKNLIEKIEDYQKSFIKNPDLSVYNKTMYEEKMMQLYEIRNHENYSTTKYILEKLDDVK